MTVRLEGIKFNYDPDLKKTGAFNIRRNETQPVSIPEWQPTLPSDFQASPAAYTICDLPIDMTIQASFFVEGGLQSPVLVRAVADLPDHLLGAVEPIQIPNSGSSGYITLQLPDARVRSGGVGIYDITWRWQFSAQSAWTDFQTTRHRMYTVVARPSEPWEPKSRDSLNIHQPWTEVLEYACRWGAGGTSDLDTAAKSITNGFFKQASKVAKYKKGGSYAFSKFKCTNFLRLLSGDPGVSHTINCDDCATAVSTFANILGCQLFQSSLGFSFSTFPVLLVGADKFKAKGFRYHAVGWKGECKETDEVFDGCLQIDEDHVDPLIGVQPTDVPFGDEAEGYKFFLVNNSPDCHPIPEHPDYGRRRRKFGPTYLADVAIHDQELIARLKRDFNFDAWPRENDQQFAGTRTIESITDFLKAIAGSEWAFLPGEHFTDERFPNVIDAVFRRPASFAEELLAVTVYESKDTNDPNLNLLEILGRFEEHDFKQIINPEMGDVVFVDSDRSTLVLRKGRLLAVVRSAGKRQLPVIKGEDIPNNPQIDQEIMTKQRRDVMPHLFKELKTCYKFKVSGGKWTLEEDGYVDLSDMDDDGNIPKGRHFDKDAGKSHDIKGRAYKHKGDLYLTFTHDDDRRTFAGKLLSDPDDDQEILVYGTFADEDPDDAKAKGRTKGTSIILDQQEQPIVIGKP